MSNITDKRIWGTAVVAIISLLLLQSLWLLYSYKMQKLALRETVNDIMSSSVDKELDNRYKKYLSHEETLYASDNKINDGTVRWEKPMNQEELREASPFQQILKFIDKPFDINILDSIFNIELVKSGIKARYLLLYTDSTDSRIENAGNLKEVDKKGLIKTNSILIVDGKRVEAVVDVAIPTIFKRMILILVLSLAVFLLLSYLFYYQGKSLFTQQKLQRLRIDFVNALIHNFKSPLNTVALELSYLKADVYPTKEERGIGIQDAIDANGKMMKLMEKTLTMARLEDKKLMLKYSETNINALIAKIAYEYKNYSGKKVYIKITADSPDIVADMDAEQVEDVLRNLIDNAIKYSGDSLNIEICCSANDNQLKINVKDDGDGISPQAQKAIMVKFERGDAINKKGVTGFGLGLYYVKQVIEAHGGNIALESEKGRGTTIRLMLPLKESFDNINKIIQQTDGNNTVIADRR
ncbi:MAG: HAMP domain-containing histidine kinase [Tannerella sp.]|jgi:two-component system phosphate regulon sensor histidine kinase PhoR|nr:HAMP domain-containing histidine kinase [Tannerella sp.]